MKVSAWGTGSTESQYTVSTNRKGTVWARNKENVQSVQGRASVWSPGSTKSQYMHYKKAMYGPEVKRMYEAYKKGECMKSW